MQRLWSLTLLVLLVMLPELARAVPIGTAPAEPGQLSIKNFGARIDGTTDDALALGRAQTQSPNNTIIHIPAGDMALSVFPQNAARHYWMIDGTTFDGGNAFSTMGNADPIFTHGSAGWWFTRGNYYGSDTPGGGAAPVVRIDSTYAVSAGVFGNVTAGLQDNCNLHQVQLLDSVWCNQTVMHESSYGSAQHVGVGSSVFRDVNATSDGKGPRSELWAFYGEVHDSTGLSSDVAGQLVGMELDVSANDRDPGASGDGGDRIIAQFGAHMPGNDGSGIIGRIGHGITVGSVANQSYLGHMYEADGPYDRSAIDTTAASPLNVNATTTAAQSAAGTTLTFATTHGGIQVGEAVSGDDIAPGTTVLSLTDTTVTLSLPTTAPIAVGGLITFALTEAQAPAVRMRAGQVVDLSGDGTHELSYVAGTGLIYTVNGATKMTVADDGTITAKAFVQATTP